jgi:hypothetical protein
MSRTMPKRRWGPTRTLACATWIQAGATVILVLITGFYACETRRLTNYTRMIGVVPDIFISLAHNTDGSAKLRIANDGGAPITDLVVNVNYALFVVVTPPHRVYMLKGGDPWWTEARLDPGTSKTRDLTEITQRIGYDIKQHEQMRQRGNFPGTPKGQLCGVAVFNTAFHRVVDRKRFTTRTRLLVCEDEKTGKPFIFEELFQT